MDFRDMTDDELKDLMERADDEIRRRRVLASAVDRMQALTNEVLDAEGVVSGEPWRETLFGYPADWEVTHPLPDSDVEATWVNEVQGNRYEPGSAGGGWTLLPPDADTPPLWVRPAWAELGYAKGDEVTYPTYEDGTVYRSLIDKNTWSPDDYPDGWEQVSSEEDAGSSPEEPGDEDGAPVWQKPEWAAEEGGAYAKGDVVLYPDEDGQRYVSVHDGWNTWSPEDYGWELA